MFSPGVFGLVVEEREALGLAGLFLALQEPYPGQPRDIQDIRRRGASSSGVPGYPTGVYLLYLSVFEGFRSFYETWKRWSAEGLAIG